MKKRRLIYYVAATLLVIVLLRANYRKILSTRALLQDYNRQLYSNRTYLNSSDNSEKDDTISSDFNGSSSKLADIMQLIYAKGRTYVANDLYKMIGDDDDDVMNKSPRDMNNETVVHDGGQDMLVKTDGKVLSNETKNFQNNLLNAEHRNVDTSENINQVYATDRPNEDQKHGMGDFSVNNNAVTISTSLEEVGDKRDIQLDGKDDSAITINEPTDVTHTHKPSSEVVNDVNVMDTQINYVEQNKDEFNVLKNKNDSFIHWQDIDKQKDLNDNVLDVSNTEYTMVKHNNDINNTVINNFLDIDKTETVKVAKESNEYADKNQNQAYLTEEALKDAEKPSPVHDKESTTSLDISEPIEPVKQSPNEEKLPYVQSEDPSAHQPHRVNKALHSLTGIEQTDPVDQASSFQQQDSDMLQALNNKNGLSSSKLLKRTEPIVHSVTEQTSTVNIHSNFKLIWDTQQFKAEVDHCHGECKFISLPARRGRMGNNMFQIASLIGTALELDLVPVISSTFALKRYFKLPNILDLNVKKLNACVERGYGVHSSCNGQTLPLGNVSFTGFRQSWKYFSNAENIVKTVFRFRPMFMEHAIDYMDSIKATRKPYYKVVGIHVRRGDITAAKRMIKGNAVFDHSFFTKAMHYFKKKYKFVTFLIMSDDKKWCKENLRGSNIVYSPFKDPGKDMALMTLCENMILTYGTFGWWGAWLSGRPAVYFWENPRPGSRGANGRRQFDYYPSNWIPMTN